MDISTILKEVPDFRINRRKLYPLEVVLGLALCAVVCGAEDFEDMAEYSRSKFDFLKTIFDLPFGTPSHDTFNRVFKLLEPEAFSRVLTAFSAQLVSTLLDKQVCIDGKCIRSTNTAEGSGNRCQTILSAWVAEHNLVIGQACVDEKSNEITALPNIIADLNLEGATVSIDAMGCQKEIAEQIAEKGGTYFLAVKGNQGTLLMELEKTFEQNKEKCLVDIDTSQGHGRLETRTCYVCKDLSQIHVAGLWKDLSCLVLIESKRQLKNSDQIQQETRYYIANKVLTPKKANQIARNHWAIENKLHWHLDVTFNEDNQANSHRIVTQNLNTLYKFALQIIEQHKMPKLSKKSKRKKAAWNDDLLIEILTNIKN